MLLVICPCSFGWNKKKIKIKIKILITKLLTVGTVIRSATCCTCRLGWVQHVALAGSVECNMLHLQARLSGRCLFTVIATRRNKNVHLLRHLMEGGVDQHTKPFFILDGMMCATHSKLGSNCNTLLWGSGRRLQPARLRCLGISWRTKSPYACCWNRRTWILLRTQWSGFALTKHQDVCFIRSLNPIWAASRLASNLGLMNAFAMYMNVSVEQSRECSLPAEVMYQEKSNFRGDWKLFNSMTVWY